MITEDKAPALLGALEHYDRHLIKTALEQYRYIEMDLLRAATSEEIKFDDRVTTVRVHLDRLDRATELMEALA